MSPGRYIYFLIFRVLSSIPLDSKWSESGFLIPEFQDTVFRYGRVLNFLHGNLRFDASGVRTSILRYFYDRVRFCELLLEMPANFAYLR